MGTQVDRIRALADVSRMRASDGDLGPLLEAVARAISESLAFRVVVINLYRPAWDDFEVAVVHGSDDARAALAGGTLMRESWETMLDPRFERGGAYLITDPGFDWPESDGVVWDPSIEPSDDPDAWQPEDALFVPMRGHAGELLGVVSVDAPESGRRPTDDDLEVLTAIAAHAGLAIAGAQAAVEGARHRNALDQLLRVSAGLRGQEGVDRLLSAVCVGVQEALDFDRVAVFLGEPGRRLAAAAGRGGLERHGRARGRHLAARRGAAVRLALPRRGLPARQQPTRRPGWSPPATGSTRRCATAAGRRRGTTTGCSCPCTRPTAS